MGLKAKIEAVIYAAEEPITLEQISLLVKDIVLAEEAAAGKARTDSLAETEPLKPAATPEAEGASASDTSEPPKPAPLQDASNDAAVSQPDGFAEESGTEANEF